MNSEDPAIYGRADYFRLLGKIVLDKHLYGLPYEVHIIKFIDDDLHSPDNIPIMKYSKSGTVLYKFNNDDYVQCDIDIKSSLLLHQSIWTSNMLEQRQEYQEYKEKENFLRGALISESPRKSSMVSSVPIFRTVKLT